MESRCYCDEKPKINIVVDKIVDGYEISEKILFRNRFEIRICTEFSSTNNPTLAVFCKELTAQFVDVLNSVKCGVLLILEDKFEWFDYCCKHFPGTHFENIVKPYHCTEITEMIDRLLGLKTTVKDKATILSYKSFLKLDISNNRLYVNSILVDLTDSEVILLRALIDKQGEFLSCSKFNSYIRNHELDMCFSQNHLRTGISRLRHKTKIQTGYTLISDKYGKGYSLNL